MLNFSVPETQTINYAAVTDLDGRQVVFHVMQLTVQEAHPESLAWGENELLQNTGEKVKLVKLTARQAKRWTNRAEGVKSISLATILMQPILRVAK